MNIKNRINYETRKMVEGLITSQQVKNWLTEKILYKQCSYLTATDSVQIKYLYEWIKFHYPSISMWSGESTLGTDMICKESGVSVPVRNMNSFKIAFKLKKNLILVNFENSSVLTNDLDIGKFYMQIFIFGKNRKHIKSNLIEYLKKAITAKQLNLNFHQVLYNITYSDDKNELVYSSIIAQSRALDSLFFDNDICNDIIDIMNSWDKNTALYSEKGIIHKTGILLQGSPGTGKSTLVQAISSHFGYNIVNIDLTQWNKIDIVEVAETINADKATYIILLEEIDTLFSSRNNEISDEEKKGISKMLQFLDSSISPNSVVFIATTNYPDRLDPALIRKGRFNHIINVTGITKEETAIKMAKSFGLAKKDIADLVENLDLSTPLSQATFQQMIIDKIREAEMEEN